MAKLDFGGFVIYGPDGFEAEVTDFELPGIEGRRGTPLSGHPIEEIIGRMILPDLFGELVPREPNERIPAAETFFDNLRRRAQLNLTESRRRLIDNSLGVYNTRTKQVEIRELNSFRSSPEFYRVCAHECAHWTAPHVGRDAGDAILSQIGEYVESVGFDNLPKRERNELERRVRVIKAKEELLAERTAIKVMQHLGLDTHENNLFSVQYLKKYLDDVVENSNLPLNVHTDWVDEESDKAYNFMLSLQEAA